jgi:hypothetical protein
LPLVAVIGASVALLCTIASTAGRQPNLADMGETRRVAETTLARLEALHPDSIADPAFREAIVQSRDAPYVATVWLFAPDGRIVEGNRAVAPGSTVEGLATSETRRGLGILPAGMLSAEQRLAVLAASAMQAEGEHDDVFRHLLREIRGPDGGMVALVGVTYDVSPAVGSPGPGWMATLLAGFLGLAAYWLSLPAWVWLDARARGERAWVWAVFVLLGNLVGLITYILARRPRPQPAAAGGVLQSTEPS